MSRVALRYRDVADMPVGMRSLYEKGTVLGVDAGNDDMTTVVKGVRRGGVISITSVEHHRHPKRAAAGEMNKTEARYAQQLEALRSAGDVTWWGFERMKLRLAHKTFLTVDFVVVLAGGAIEAVDVKGRKGDRYWAEEDAKVKLKVAAAQFPWLRFVVAWPAKGGGWCREVVPA